MKSALFILLAAVFVAVSCQPAEAEEDIDRSALPWYNTYSYPYMMCRLKCRQYCLEQGFWKGVCKQGATCYCYGPMGPQVRANGFPVSMY